MSGAAEGWPGGPPPEWNRLEEAAESLARTSKRWAERARHAEEELERLRRSLEEFASGESAVGNLAEETRRLKAENAALRSRMLQARKRISSLMQRLAVLGLEDE